MAYENFVITTRFSDCCKGCTKRHLNCHSECPEYLAAKEEQIERTRERLERDWVNSQTVKKKRRKGSWQLGGGWRDDR